MKTTNDVFSFKTTLAKLPRGEPLCTTALAQLGVSAFRASALARSGWLTHLARSVYMLPGDTLTRDACLAFLSRQDGSFHVGSKTALAWRGVRHNIAFREVLTLWGARAKRLPGWFLQRFESHYQSSQVFDAELPINFGVQPLPAGHPGVGVSVPERAVLELLSDVGKHQSLSEARELFVALPPLREPVLDTLLAHTSRIKVVRLAHALAQQFELPWVALAAQHSLRLGGGKRWVALGKTGERIDLKRP